jgi:hypothetical protein
MIQLLIGEKKEANSENEGNGEFKACKSLYLNKMYFIIQLYASHVFK